MVSSLIRPLLPYKCSGHGCACDIAGKELAGCACFGIIEESNEKADLNTCTPEIKSCCSAEKEEHTPKNNDSTIDKTGCDGLLSDLYEMLDRHLNFQIHASTTTHYFIYPSSPIKLLAYQQVKLIALDKIPIV
ncbi:hypothetical protein PQO03_07945 [Lentisphaera profundi]|uniref:Uncharacterized protein n=1 Tax=Lentisphaera profundi TaxID=1658616 RepID=A0ABY7VRY3_9BACT|nr:hypothetical protein [Lentisphaera profundi]WDE95652.1 hypothetical protein PQO03_07945 [Lentisphaera profundi]